MVDLFQVCGCSVEQFSIERRRSSRHVSVLLLGSFQFSSSLMADMLGDYTAVFLMSGVAGISDSLVPSLLN